MKIAVLHLGFFYAGGGERLVLEQVRGLRRAGHQVDCFAPIVRAEACHPELIEEVGVTPLLPPPPAWLPAQAVVWVLLCCLLAPALALRFRRYQVILAANQPALWLAWVAAGILRKPYVAYLAQPLRVLHPRPVDLEVGQPNADYRLAAAVTRCARPLVSWADRRSVAGARRLLANGDHVAAILERIYRLPVLSCPAGGRAVPEEDLGIGGGEAGEIPVNGISTARPYVLLTNRHYPQKRFEHALRALVAAPSMRLVVTGARTAYTAEIEQLAGQLGVCDRLQLTGLVSQRCLHHLYEQAAVYVYPAPEEDYGIGIVEAMAHGLPVVAWGAAGPAAIVEHEVTGLLVPPGDEEQFAAAIGRLLEDPALRQRLGRAAWRRVAGGLSETVHLRTLERELEAALAGAPARSAEPPRRVAVLHCGFIYSGGGERIVIEEVLGLRRLGYEVDCFAPTVDAEACYPDLLPEVAPRTFLPQLPSWLPLRDAIEMVAASTLVPLYAWRFRRYDVLLGANQPGAWIAWCLGYLVGAPYVVYLNQPNRLVHPREIDRRTGWQNRSDYHVLNAVIQRLRFLVRWADHRSVRAAATLLVNGGYIGEVIRRTYGRGIADCPAGTHLRPGRPLHLRRRFGGLSEVNGHRLSHPYVLLTNRHEPQKRFDLAIQALTLVHGAHPGVQLVVPGPPTAHTPALRNLALQLGLGEAVLFCGPVSEERLQRLYDEAAVYVYPAPEEDFGMGVIEAMASGIPVVAWNQAGPTVTVEAGVTGHLAAPGDLADYAAGITSYLSDPEENQATGRRAHERAWLFSWHRHVATLEQALIGACGASHLAEPAETGSMERAESAAEAGQAAGTLVGE